jgi:hypothetical protein
MLPEIVKSEVGVSLVASGGVLDSGKGVDMAFCGRIASLDGQGRVFASVLLLVRLRP